MAKLIYPIDPFFLTQIFGVNKQNYAKFGLDGHNGWDFRTKWPDTPEGRRYIIASFLSEFYRRGNDPPGYGLFFETIVRLKTTWKLTFAHCHSIEEFAKKNAGDHMAISDNTGNSTGAHLHLTVKPIRIRADGTHENIEQNNGYFGAVDPQRFFGELQAFQEGGETPMPTNPNTIAVPKEDFERMVIEGTNGKKVLEKMGFKASENGAGDLAIQFLDRKDAELTKSNTRIGELEMQIQQLQAQPKMVMSDLVARFTSRKFLVAVLGALIPVLNQLLGWGLSIDQVLTILTPILVFIGAEGWKDIKMASQ